MDSEWARIARDLAAVVRRAEALEIERGQLAVEREKLERRLAEMLDASERPARVPAWAQQRREWSVLPGHGAETARLKPGQQPLSHLSTAIPCPSGCKHSGQVRHSHYADGVVHVWE